MSISSHPNTGYGGGHGWSTGIWTERRNHITRSDSSLWSCSVPFLYRPEKPQSARRGARGSADLAIDERCRVRVPRSRGDRGQDRRSAQEWLPRPDGNRRRRGRPGNGQGGPTARGPGPVVRCAPRQVRSRQPRGRGRAARHRRPLRRERGARSRRFSGCRAALPRSGGRRGRGREAGRGPRRRPGLLLEVRVLAQTVRVDHRPNHRCGR